MTATRTIASTSWRDIEETLSPRASAAEESLPPLLIVLTIVTGVVDALAYLRLGHVFVANMTGNVVFLGFAAAGAGGLSVPGRCSRWPASFPAVSPRDGWPPASAESVRGLFLEDESAANRACLLPKLTL
jgi:hypothetical protein